MGQYDFTYEIPADLANRITQLLQQKPNGRQMVEAFKNCSYEYEDLGLAYYAGVKGDNWNKKALDFTIEGSERCINLLRNRSSDLKDTISKSLRSSTSGYIVRNILFLYNDIVTPFPTSNEARLNADIATANLVLSDLIKIGGKLCSNAAFHKDIDENTINDYFRDAFSLMVYCEVKDQTRHGLSANGMNAGEVDILITKDNKEIAIFEGLKLNSVNTTYIDSHINKAIINYNALGTATFIVAYVTVADFEAFCKKCAAYLQAIEFPLQVKKKIEIKPYTNAAIRIAETILSRDGFDFPVYFVALNLN